MSNRFEVSSLHRPYHEETFVYAAIYAGTLQLDYKVAHQWKCSALYKLAKHTLVKESRQTMCLLFTKGLIPYESLLLHVPRINVPAPLCRERIEVLDFRAGNIRTIE